MSALVTATVPAASYVQASGTYTLSGAGVINTSNPYNFNFKHVALTGDFTFTARIVSQGGSSDGARAGVAAVEALSGTPAYAWVARYASTGDIRAAINGNNKSSISGFSTSTVPVWVRVRRVGTSLFQAASTDGVTWTEKTPANLTSSVSTLYVGLALSSGSNTTVVTANFDNVTVTGGGL